MINIFLIIFGTSMLANCAGMPVSSMIKLRNVEPHRTNLTSLRFAIKTPLPIVIIEEGVKLEMKLNKIKEKPAVTEKFVLRAESIEVYGSELQGYREPDAKISVFRLAEVDIPRFEKLRNQTDGVGNRRHGSMQIHPDLCRAGGYEMKQILISTFLKTEETGEFVPLILDKDVTKHLAEFPITDCHR